MSKTLIKIISVVLVFCGCGDFPFSPGNETGSILFVSDRDGQSQIYAMNEDGGNQKRITRSKFRNYNPRWSRDGRSIVFNSDRSSNIHFQAIVVANANGGNERVLLEHGVWPVFSLRSDKIAFSFDTLLPGFGTPYDIVFYDQTENKATLFKEDSSFSDILRDWSPDGRYLLVESDKGTTNRKLIINTYSIDLGDSSRTKLTEGPISIHGRFSPDGQSIVYVHKDSSGTPVRNVYIMNRDGSDKRNVTNSDTLSALTPTWSPDGTKILFINWEGQDQSGVRQYSIYLVNVDGTGKVKLTTENGFVEASGLDWRW